jgi:hypothetical protein
MQTPATADPNPVAILDQEKKQRDIKTRKENKERDRQRIQDIEDGLGYSSDKILARYFDTTRKTIWIWSKEGKLPRPHKIGANTTRWLNAEIKSIGVSK